MSDLPHIIAQMRRLYHHMIHGGQITADDLARQIAALEAVNDAIAHERKLSTGMAGRTLEIIEGRDAEIERLNAFVEWVHFYTNDPEISAEATKHLAPLPWEGTDV